MSYSASAALESQGCTLTIRDPADTTEPFTDVAIGEIVSFKGPGGTAPIYDLSNLESTRREKKVGLPDEGQLTLEVNMLAGDTGQDLCKSCRASRAKTTFILTFTDPSPGPTTATFLGYVLEYSVTGGVGAKITAAITIEITGEVVWAP